MTTTAATRFLELEDAPIPSPFPEGWYFIETREVIEKAGLLSKMWMGEEIIAWSDGDGSICVAEAHCPHLGANLSPEMGGRIVDGCLVCPFHGFTYDATGQCISTPYTNPPPTARLSKIPHSGASWTNLRLVGHESAASPMAFAGFADGTGRLEFTRAKKHPFLPAIRRKPRRIPSITPTLITCTASAR